MFTAALHSLLLVSLCALCFALNTHWATTTGTIPAEQALSVYLLFVLEYLFILYTYAKSQNDRAINTIVIASLVGRVLLAFAPVLLTGDLPRYLWEGLLVREGFNPYFYVPAHTALTPLRTDYWASIEYSHLSAIYPPVAQYFLALFARSVLLWKLFLVIVEACNIYLLMRLVKEFSAPRGMVLAYACLPLALFEISLSGHLEGIVVTFLLAFFLYIRSLELRAFFVYKDTIPVPAMLALALLCASAILTKYVLALPVAVFLILRGKHFGLLRFSFFSFSFVFFCLLICAPFLKVDGELVSLFSSLSTYISHWRFNDSVLHLLGFLFGADWSDTNSFWHLKALLLAVWTLVMALLLYKARNSVKPTMYGFAAYLILSPVFHPWYGLWFAPLVALEPSPALLYLLLALPISYVSKIGGVGGDPAVIWKAVEFAPLLPLLLWRNRVFPARRES
jgi:hypothetical protein